MLRDFFLTSHDGVAAKGVHHAGGERQFVRTCPKGFYNEIDLGRLRYDGGCPGVPVTNRPKALS